MGLALCHRVPRHPVVYVALGLLLCSGIFQVVCIALVNRNDGGGVLKSDKRSGSVAYIAAGPQIFGCKDTGDNCSLDSCSMRLDWISRDCANFLEGFHTVNSCVIVGFSFTILSLVFSSFFALPLGGNPGHILLRLVVAVALPTGFICGAVCTFFIRVVSAAKNAISKWSTNTVDSGVTDLGTIHFSGGVVLYLYLVATALACAALLMMIVFAVIEWCTASDVPQTEERKNKRSGVLPPNDDYLRQRGVLTNHARTVWAEIQFKTEVDPSFIGNDGA